MSTRWKVIWRALLAPTASSEKHPSSSIAKLDFCKFNSLTFKDQYVPNCPTKGEKQVLSF